MPKDYDVIVIGAGNGGLAAAAFTAKTGKKTLLVEKHNIPGGSATSFVRGRFEFETSLHELASVGTAENPGGIRKLFDMLGADIDWRTGMEGTYRLIVPEEGIDADMPCGIPNFCAKMEELVPGSLESTRKVFYYGKLAAEACAFMDDPAYTPEEMEKRYPDYTALAGHTTTEVLDALGMPKKAQNIITTYWSYTGAPADSLDFTSFSRMLLVYVIYGAGMPALRSHELSMALEKAIRDNGGEIWYNTEVNRILVKDGKAYGVVIGGKEYLADQIVCNAFPDAVYGKMMDPAEVPERAVKLVNSRQLGLSFSTVYLGLNKSMEELGITSYSHFISRSSDSRQQYDWALNTHEYGDYVIMNCLNKLIPDCTPEGTCQLFFTTFYFGSGWDDVTPEEYQKLKNETAEKMIRHAEEALGISIRPYIEEIVIACPPTFARYLNTPGGTPYGYQMSPTDNLLQRSLNAKNETFIENLHFVGAHTHRGDGFSSAYLSGLDAGKAILRADRQKGGMER